MVNVIACSYLFGVNFEFVGYWLWRWFFFFLIMGNGGDDGSMGI